MTDEQQRIVTELKGLLEGKQFRANRAYPMIGNTLSLCICTCMPDQLLGKTEVVLQISTIGSSRQLGGIQVTLIHGDTTQPRWLDQYGRVSWTMIDPTEFSFLLSEPEPSNR